ncbi:MAG: TlpA family protein disulfide reductase [Gammaproteobacteria bacterium]|nr:TlpA family protein disulfide reductase [Gammaproteobacteria bacterium]
MRLLLILILILSNTLTLASDEIVNLQEYRGKVVVVDFWASWCVPCRRSFPWMNTMHEKYSEQGLVIVAVNLDPDAADAAAFLADHPAVFKIAYDPAASLAKEYGVIGMPSSYIFGRDGELISSHAGFKVKKQDEYEAAFVAALKQE